MLQLVAQVPEKQIICSVPIENYAISNRRYAENKQGKETHSKWISGFHVTLEKLILNPAKTPILSPQTRDLLSALLYFGFGCWEGEAGVVGCDDLTFDFI